MERQFVETTYSSAMGPARTEDPKMSTAQGMLLEEVRTLRLFQDESSNTKGSSYSLADEYERNMEAKRERRTIIKLVLASVFTVLFGISGTVSLLQWRRANGARDPAYRFFFFFAALPPLWFLAAGVNHVVLNLVELLNYRTPLFYMHRIRMRCREVLFMTAVLVWFLAIFEMIDCGDEGQCGNTAAFMLARAILLDIVLCLLVFTIGNFLATMITKFLTNEYYESAHGKKLTAAIEQEYFLIMLTAEQEKPATSSGRIGRASVSDPEGMEHVVLDTSTHHDTDRLLDGKDWLSSGQTGLKESLAAIFSPEMLDKMNAPGFDKVDPLRFDNILANRTFTALVRKYSNMTELQEKEQQAMADKYASVLYNNVRGKRTRDYLRVEDFVPFFPDRDHAESAFKCFDKDNDGRLTKEEVRTSVQAVYSERKDMAQSLRDTDDNVGGLELCIIAIMQFVLLAVYLFIWNVSIQTTISGIGAFSGTATGLGFMFQGLVREFFENIMFLFTEHAYDVGDVLRVDGGPLLRVKKVHLMSTVFASTATCERIIIPNSKLRDTQITNTTQSANRLDNIKFMLDVGTSLDDLRRVEAAGTAHIRANQADFEDDSVMLVMHSVDNPYKVTVSFWWQYSFTGDKITRMCIVKTGIVNAIQSELQALRVEHTVVYLQHKPKQE